MTLLVDPASQPSKFRKIGLKKMINHEKRIMPTVTLNLNLP